MEATRLCPYCLQPLPDGAQSCPHCGKSFAGRNPGGTLPVGTVLAGRYTVGEMLSIDGEGILYRGAENLGRFRVTIKEYLPITLTAERTVGSVLRPKTGSEVLFKTTRMDFADLYHSIQRITPANGLEAVLDVVETNNTVYAVLENPGGTPLDQWLENHPGPIRPDDACAMLQPVFEGVAAMHKIGLVHRGICPENIRVMENGRCRLAGYATVGLRTAGSGLHEQLYEGYSAPEQYSTAQFEGRYTDEYSLAAVFYRMVCGQAPVPAAQRVVADSNPRAKSVNGSLPLYVSQVLQLGLRLRPMERIQTVPQLYQALSSKEYTAELTRTMKPETPVRTAPPEPERKEHLLSLKALLAGILILLSILILLTLWGILGRKNESASSAVEPEPASSEVMVPQNLVPNFIGMDYTQVQNNREYTSMYLFYVTEEYSDTAPAGQIIQQQRPADGGNTQHHRLYAGWRSEGAGSPGPCGQLLYGGERRLLCIGLCRAHQRGARHSCRGGHGHYGIYRGRPQRADYCHAGGTCSDRTHHGAGNACGRCCRPGGRYGLKRARPLRRCR